MEIIIQITYLVGFIAGAGAGVGLGIAAFLNVVWAAGAIKFAEKFLDFLSSHTNKRIKV